MLPDGLRIAGALAREDPRDALVLPSAPSAHGLDAVVAALGPTPRIGTSSVRRAAALTRAFPGATFHPDPRQRRYAAAQARRWRLRRPRAGRSRPQAARARGAHLGVRCPVDVCVPAPGQGIVAIEIAEAAARADARRRRRDHRCRRDGGAPRRARGRAGAWRRVSDAARRARAHRRAGDRRQRRRRVARRQPACVRAASRDAATGGRMPRRAPAKKLDARSSCSAALPKYSRHSSPAVESRGAAAALSISSAPVPARPI